MDLQRVKLGVIGCGVIAGNYLKNFAAQFPIIQVAACADLDLNRARARAKEFNVPRACTPQELLADPEIEIVLNLTIPEAHFPVSMSAVAAGKASYAEKPICVTPEQAETLLAAAARKGVRLGCSPDMCLGAGPQTARRMIDDGTLGTPVACNAIIQFRGHESWHPNPEFYYAPGGGPMFDMGVYNLTLLIALLGPVRRVTGLARASFAERTITSQPKSGQKIKVDVDTHVAGLLEFASGVIGTVIASFDVWGTMGFRVEVHGSEGSMVVPEGPEQMPALYRPGKEDWAPIAPAHQYRQECRGIGVADMAVGLRTGRPHRCNGEMAAHVLEIMHAIHVSSREGRHITLKTTCERPAPMPENLRPGEFDL